MNKLIPLLIGCILLLLTSSCKQEVNTQEDPRGVALVTVDLSESRSGKLSEFFEPEINYIWLEDKLDEAQLNAGLHQIRFYGDKIYTLDIYGCKCISIFNMEGEYLGKIAAYGEGPGEFLEFDALTFVNEELVLLGVYPRKIMWFSLEGEFLRELTLIAPFGPGVFSEFDNRYYLYSSARNTGEFFIQTLNENLQDTINFLPYYSERLESMMSGRNYFQKSKQYLYFGMTFLDTIYQFHNQQLVPKFVFDFGKYGQDLEELKGLGIMDRSKFMSSQAKLYFLGRYHVSEKQLYTILSFEKKVYNLFYDREKSQSHVIEGNLINDIDEGHDSGRIFYVFEPGKVGIRITGKDLYQALVEKKKQLGKEEFENWAKGKGRDFAKTALAAKDSENPVLIVYKLK
ncbi:6-bladed beta-propeller [Cyclobacterium sp. 1_MG-2023]|uniref:6-bladed beta-propeller n=1 Tax=Cyclobacterium sp. 1_MG-2023 TaxID=3062681 RepID=UPI0026E14DA7|nr:6-bladed beta-propeller [Cyclobacterium sp. 1_MG-2023]MDO6439125.1 6-bladed beta-propeller [Cyclobacterium sp. 1_MG-2023]